MYLDNINITGTPNAPIANFYSILKTVCVGDELQLLDSSLNKPDSWNWYFTDADTLTSIIRNPKVKFLTPGLKTISLAVKNVNGKDSVTRVSYINILPSPAPPGIASSNGLNLCNGDSTVLSTDATSGFIWYKDNLIYSTSLTSFKVKDEANFYVKQLGTGGCTANSPTLFVQTGISPPVPTITKDLSGNNFCDGGVFNLSSSSLTNNQWFVNDTLFIGAVSKNLSSTEAGKFKVRVNDKICFSFSDSLVIIKLDKPNTSPIVGTTWAVKGDTALFSVVPGISGSIFTWTPVGATILSGAGTKDVSLKMGIGASASVNIQETSSAGCSGDKKSLSVNLVSTSVVKFANSFGIAIYPNPANKSLQISSDKLSNELMDIQIINLLGQTMMHIQGSFNTNSQIKEINIESLPPSLYIIQIKIGNRNLTDRFTKE
jgi:PKD repeat protein